MKSMTGYALTEKTEPNSFISLELKSYNSRYLDLNLNFPFWLSALEPVFRAYFSEKIARGKVEVSLHVKDADIDVDILTNTKVAKAYAKAMREVAEAAGISRSTSHEDYLGHRQLINPLHAFPPIELL